MDKIKENFSNHKQSWILLMALAALIILIFGIPGLLPDHGSCPPGVLYNLKTGRLCPEEPAPYVDPKTIIPGKG